MTTTSAIGEDPKPLLPDRHSLLIIATWFYYNNNGTENKEPPPTYGNDHIDTPKYKRTDEMKSEFETFNGLLGKKT